MIKGWTLIFYGTTQPIDKNDPISVAVEPPTSVANSSVTVLTKQAGGKGGRKQQKQQQKPSGASNSSSVPSAPRKGGKPNQKNQSGKNGKQKQQQTTSSRPPTTLYFNKDRKYEFANGVISVNKPSPGQTTTARPPKVAGNSNAVKDDKLTYVKTPIKAPKQVKQSDGDAPNRLAATATAAINDPNAHVEFIDSFQFTSNPNIPKLFQQYEKIQEFYPEFHPYVGANGRASTRFPSSNGSGGGGKPSRANQQFQSQFPSSLSIASNGFSSSAASAQATSKFLSTALLATATKKSSQAQAARKQNSTISSRNNGKG